MLLYTLSYNCSTGRGKPTTAQNEQTDRFGCSSPQSSMIQKPSGSLLNVGFIIIMLKMINFIRVSRLHEEKSINFYNNYNKVTWITHTAQQAVQWKQKKRARQKKRALYTSSKVNWWLFNSAVLLLIIQQLSFSPKHLGGGRVDNRKTHRQKMSSKPSITDLPCLIMSAV